MAKAVPAYQRICDHLRGLIASGEMPYGTRLPSVQVLATQYGTSVFTIQNALAPLVREGLLESAPRRGTFVRSRPGELRSVGVYFGRSFWAGAEMAFYRELDQQLARELQSDGIRKFTWIDARSDSEQAEPFPDLVAAVENRAIQGLIVANVNPIEMAWLESLPVSLSAFSSHPIPARVGLDTRQMMNAAVSDLKRQGCRSVGLIFPRPMWGPEDSDHVPDVISAFPDFRQAAASEGMEIRDEWIRTPPRHLPSREYPEFGRREFLALWKRDERPDGLIVYPDNIVTGVSMAILEERVSVPEELKLVLHRNEGVDFLCPLVATWLVTSVRQVALALVQQLRSQLDGKNVAPIYLPYMIEPVFPARGAS